MALQFVLGDLSANKKRVLSRKILEIKEKNPAAIIYFIVPEHVKFDMETLLLNEMKDFLHTDKQAMLDIQVMSFTRLAWFMLPANLKAKTQLTKVGLSMLIRQILQAKQKELIVYRNQINYQGFIEKLLALFEELYEGRILAEDIYSMELNGDFAVEIDEEYDVEAQRLKEIALLYQAYIEAIEGLELANYQSYDDLIQLLRNGPMFDNHYVFIDHFYFFDAQQMALIMEMVRSFTQVWVTLPLNEEDLFNQQWLPISQVPKNTYLQMKEMAGFLQLEVDEYWKIQGPYYNYRKDILRLAKHFKEINQDQTTSSENSMIEIENIFYWQSDCPQTEIRHLSNQIHYLVHKMGYRYHDILVVARDMDRYQDIVGPYFKMNEIPYFFDHRSLMDQHPLMLWVESVLNLKRYNWQFNDLMYVLKSDLYYPNKATDDELMWTNQEIEEFQHQKYLLENTILANGYLSYRFTDLNFKWSFDQENILYENVVGEKTKLTIGALTHSLRTWMVETIAQPLQRWKNSFTGEEGARWLYQLIEKSGVKDRLIFLRDQAIEAGDIEASRQHEQVWQVLVDTLNEFHQLYGKEKVSFDVFTELIMAGLNEGNYHIIPPTMDQVTITNMVSPQVQPAKICFIIGANHQVLPQYQENDSLLTSENRHKLQENLEIYQYLTDNVQKQSHLELLLIHQLLLNATDQLYISYASNVNDQQLELAAHLKELQREFKIPMTTFDSQTNYFSQASIHSSDFGRYPIQLTPAISMVRYHMQDKTPVSSALLSLIHTIETYHSKHLQGQNRPLFQILQAILFGNPLPDYIEADTAKALYGQQINLSISKLEQYYKDPFSHFLTYGLRLREREQFQLTPAKTGDYMHEFLDRLMTDLNQKNMLLSDLTPTEFEQVYLQTLASMADDNRFNLLKSQPRFEAIQQQINRTLYQFTQVVQMQQRRIPMEILTTEATFGINQPLKGFEYQLSNGTRLSISGKIDRIDRILINDQRSYLQIVDYKSGKKDFNPLEIYYGTDLQILTYLNIALHNFQGHEPLGAFYHTIMKQQYQKATNENFQLQNNAGLMTEKLMEDNRFKGFITVDSQILDQVEPLLSEKKTSQLYPASLLKSGDYSKNSSVITADEFKLLSQYTHYLITKAGEEIMSGKITLQPFKDDAYTLSLQAEYRAISGFDSTIHYNVYRNKNLTKDKLFDTIKQQLIEEGYDA